MAYSDEWWKGKYSSDSGCPDSDPSLHSTCGYSTTSQPDGYCNEEWWGIMRVADNGSNPDIMQPRAVYDRLKGLWTNFNAFVPDLAVTYIGNLPASRKHGKSFVVKDTVVNTGGARAGRFIVRYYLSLDTIKDGNDILLTGNRIALKLKAGKNSTGKTTLTIPKKTPPGNYYLIACADDTSKVSESNETDNCTASQTTINVK